MNPSSVLLREKLSGLLEQWQVGGLPSRYEIESTAQELLEWKQTAGISGLWNQPPSMITATLDDALGKGIEIIQMFAEIAGINVTPLGIMQSPETIVIECNKRLPHLLGLTVLRSDAYEDLEYIGHNIPPNTLLIVGGGPFLQSDPELAVRAKVHLVANDVAAFIRFILDFKPP